MGELQSALDAPAADDLHGLTPGQTLDRTALGRWHTYRPDGTEILIC